MAVEDNSMEKRLYERISLPIKVKYEVKTRPMVISEALSRNISGSGICVSFAEKLLPKTELFMRIEIGSSKDIATLKGRVIWTRRVEVSGNDGPIVYYDTGIELLDADPININRIVTHFYGKSF